MINNNRLKIKLIALVFCFASFAACRKNESPTPANNSANLNTQTKSNDTQSAPSSSAEDKRTPLHRRLEALVGEWDVEKSNYFALGGTAEKPFVSKDIICKREYVDGTGKTFIKETTTGAFGGPYYRLGILGYSPIDERYEWNTVDNFNPMMMTYKGAHGSAKPDGDIVMIGEFTDPGIFPDKSTTSQTIKQRTLIKIESPDRNIMEIYFTIPGKPEMLADRVICTRRK